MAKINKKDFHEAKENLFGHDFTYQTKGSTYVPLLNLFFILEKPFGMIVSRVER